MPYYHFIFLYIAKHIYLLVLSLYVAYSISYFLQITLLKGFNKKYFMQFGVFWA